MMKKTQKQLMTNGGKSLRYLLKVQKNLLDLNKNRNMKIG